METLTAPIPMRGRDLGDEAVASLFARPGRMSLTILGTVVGLAALVATVGLSRTAGNRVVGRFDELAATQISVSVRPSAAMPGARVIPWDASERLERLNGVTAAGTISNLNVGDRLTTTSPVTDPSSRTGFRLSAYAVSAETFDAVRAVMASGRAFDGGHSDRADRVVVLGPTAAERLGVTSVRGRPAIRMGDDVYTVIGVLSGVGRYPKLLGSVILPEGTASERYSLVAPEEVIIETQIGATELVAGQVATALKPDNPRALRVRFPPEPKRVRDNVKSDFNVLFLMLGGVSLLVGSIGIANVTLVSVMERTGEIGLRRSLGATRRQIKVQFLLESSTLGLAGGILGASAGVLIVVAVSAAQQWTPVLDPWVPLLAPGLGVATGLLAGAYPATRAARMEPVEALRSAL